MAHVLRLGLLVGLAGCGSTIGSLDELPAGPDVSAVEWPRLVDTPEAPEARLMAGAGEQAKARLARQRLAAGERLARADAVEPVSGELVARGETNVSRTGDAGPGVDEAGLLARASAIQARTAARGVAVDESDLLARAALIRARTSEPAPTFSATPVPSIVATPRRPVPLRALETPVVSSSFEERARLARERAARAGS